MVLCDETGEARRSNWVVGSTSISGRIRAPWVGETEEVDAGRPCPASVVVFLSPAIPPPPPRPGRGASMPASEQDGERASGEVKQLHELYRYDGYSAWHDGLFVSQHTITVVEAGS